MSNNKENTELAVQNPGFLIFSDPTVGAMIAEELDGFDSGFERIKIPSGGMTVFEMPVDGEDTEMMKEFAAVILHHHPLRAYYKSKYTGGNAPPDCCSFDGINGVGDPGGNCENCPLNRFGSGVNDGKACKDRRRVYVLREGELFPLLLSLPTGSLEPFRKYLKSLVSKIKPSNTVLTKFSLKKAVNKGGIEYSQAVFKLDRPLTPEELSVILPLSEQVKKCASHVGFEDAVYEEATVDPDTGEVVEPLSGDSEGVPF